MEELIKIQAELAQCRRHADNHRRSRDYHKESVAKLRTEIKTLQESVEWWHNEHSQLDDDLIECKRHHHAWMMFSIITSIYAIGITVLYAWLVRL